MTAVLCQPQDVLDLVGTGSSIISTTAGSSAILTRYIERAQGAIEVKTRKKWTTQIASVNFECSYALKNACANHAARFVVNTDMSGYTSRQEAVTMINVFLDEYNNAIAYLKDLNNSEMRGVND